MCAVFVLFFFFFFNDTATTEIYTLSLHDALPFPNPSRNAHAHWLFAHRRRGFRVHARRALGFRRSEEHTSELQSRGHLVCRLLLEKKKKKKIPKEKKKKEKTQQSD